MSDRRQLFTGEGRHKDVSQAGKIAKERSLAACSRGRCRPIGAAEVITSKKDRQGYWRATAAVTGQLK